MDFDRDPVPPFEVLRSGEVGRDGDIALRRDRVRWPDGTESDFRVVEAPGAVWIVPVDEAGGTVLVRQWRHSWGGTAWEVPAGTLEAGEEPLACAQRELIEEAGLVARAWTPLGVTRGSALLAARQHLFLAREVAQVERRPESYERDMIVRGLPLREAVAAALRGEIDHATSVTALCRAARAVGLL